MTKQSIFSNIDCHALETTPLSSTGNQDITANSQGSLTEFAKMYCQQKSFSKFDETKSEKTEGMCSKKKLTIAEPMGFSFNSRKKRCI